MGAELPVFLGALVLGFAGSVHCVAMCGGIAGALGQAMPEKGPLESSARALLYSLGRISSYAIAGALAGAFGSVFEQGPSTLGLIRFVVGLVIVVIGLQIAFNGRPFAPLERAGLALWRIAAPLARRIGRPERLWQVYALGLVWGWLPCGLVYSGLLIAAASGRPTTGAIAMASFGLGTLPALLAASGLGAVVRRLGGGASVRRSAGLALVGFGLWSIVGTWVMTGLHAGHASHLAPSEAVSASPPSSDQRPDHGPDHASHPHH